MCSENEERTMLASLQITRQQIVATDVTDLIGNTPLLRISKLVPERAATVYAKLEWYNIGGSIKDRMALYMIESAEAAGKLSCGKTIIEATSGNTGIALAMIAASRGYRIKIVMPESVTIERRKIITAYGAELVLSPGELGTAGAIDLKRTLLREKPDDYVDVDQFRDPANVRAHYETTGREILEQTGGNVEMVVVGVGTGGTGVGTSKRVKEFNPKIKVVGVTPMLGVNIQGMRNPRENNPSALFDNSWFDEVIELSEIEKENAFETARLAARKEGLLVGMSAAAVLHVALNTSRELDEEDNIVAVLPDGGHKYLSTSLFRDEVTGD
jgi:cysteine synthase